MIVSREGGHNQPETTSHDTYSPKIRSINNAKRSGNRPITIVRPQGIRMSLSHRTFHYPFWASRVVT